MAANDTRGVVTSIAVTVTYPDGTTKQTTIENPQDRLEALVFQEGLAGRMAAAGLVSEAVVAEWTAPAKWQDRHTFMLVGGHAEGGVDPMEHARRNGQCLICMCQFCDNPIIVK